MTACHLTLTGLKHTPAAHLTEFPSFQRLWPVIMSHCQPTDRSVRLDVQCVDAGCIVLRVYSYCCRCVAELLSPKEAQRD